MQVPWPSRPGDEGVSSGLHPQKLGHQIYIETPLWEIHSAARQRGSVKMAGTCHEKKIKNKKKNEKPKKKKRWATREK